MVFFFPQRDCTRTCFSGHELEWSGVAGRTWIGRGRPKPHGHGGRPAPWRARVCPSALLSAHAEAPSRSPQVCAHGDSARTAERPGLAANRCSEGLSLWSYRVEGTVLGSEDRPTSGQAGVWTRWAVWPGAPGGESGPPVWVPGHPSCGPQASAGHQETPDLALLKGHT